MHIDNVFSNKLRLLSQLGCSDIDRISWLALFNSALLGFNVFYTCDSMLLIASIMKIYPSKMTWKGKRDKTWCQTKTDVNFELWQQN